MVVQPAVRRGEVWLVALDPRVGGEIQKTRPCVIISPPEMHDHLRTTLVAPMTTGSRPAPFRIALTVKGKTGLILLDQARAVDRERLVRRQGQIDDGVLKQTLSVLRAVFAE